MTLDPSIYNIHPSPVEQPIDYTPANPGQDRSTNNVPFNDLFSSQAAIVGRQVPNTVDYRISPVKGRPDLTRFSITIGDVRAGINKTRGPFQTNYDRASSSTLDTRFPGTLILHQKLATATTPDPTGNLAGISSAYVFGTLIMAAGSGANVSLVKEASSTDPTPTAITYTPPAAITCLSRIVQNGATAGEELLVGFTGANSPVTLTDAAASAGTTGHASLRPCYDHVQVDINDRTNLFLANNGLWTLPVSSAISAAPTQVATSVQNGGHFLSGASAKGMLQLGGGPRRVWAWLPIADTAGGGLLFGTEKQGMVVSWNQEGTDQQILDFGLKFVTQAFLIPSLSAIVATDGERWVLHRGSGVDDLYVFEDRPADSDKEFRIRQAWIVGPELYYVVNQRAAPSGTGNTKMWLESYHFDTGAVHQVSASTTLSSTGSYGILSNGSGPYSPTTNFLHWYADGSWYRIYAPQWGYNPWTMLRQTSGSQSSSGNEYETSGTWTSPLWELPGLQGQRKTIVRIQMLGDLDSGGTAATAATCTVTAGNAAATFYTGNPNNSKGEWSLDFGSFYLLQVSIALTRTTASTRFTPNPLPIRIEGYAQRDIIAENSAIPPGYLDGYET